MDKLLIFPGKTEQGIFTFLINEETTFLTKTAAQYHPEIAAYINAAKQIPGKTQILLTALGAGEYWGCNVNGDYFPELSLAHGGDDYGFKTFQKYAKIYKHHVNKDPNASYGDVALAVYNPIYHRVELIVMLDNTKAADIVDAINRGEYPDWSMGCRVPWDECNICGHKAPKREQYCEHLKYYMGRIVPELGKQAYAINRYPKFFDISRVLIGADRIAKTLAKVASQGRAFIGSALLAEKMAENKKAEMEKDVPASGPPASQDAVDALLGAIPEVKAREPVLPRATLDELGSLPLSSVLNTLSLMGIMPKPQEFQRIVLVSVGKRDIADQLDKHAMCFDPSWVEDPLEAHDRLIKLGGAPDERVVRLLRPYMEKRSYAMPFLAPRIMNHDKYAAESESLPALMKPPTERKPVGIIPLLMLAAGMYAAFSKRSPENAVGNIDKMLAAHPFLSAALASSVPLVFNSMAGEHIKGQYDSAPKSIPDDTNDVFARIEEQKAKPYLKVAGVGKMIAGNPASKRLFMGIPAVYMASGVLQKHRDANPYEQESRIKSFIRRNPDLIGAALAADAMLALQGKGSVQATRAISGAAGHFWSKAKNAVSSVKTASAQDFVTNALVWPLAFGKANLPSRIVGGLIDQAVLEGSKKILSNKSQNSKINKSTGGNNA
jgi:hypothetical protein